MYKNVSTPVDMFNFLKAYTFEYRKQLSHDEAIENIRFGISYFCPTDGDEKMMYEIFHEAIKLMN